MAVTISCDAPFVDDYKQVVCVTPDDGRFELPPEVLAQANELVFPIHYVGIARASSHYHVSGDAMLLVLNLSVAF